MVAEQASPRRACLVATLGTEPQVVTLALQALETCGLAIREVVVVHTAPHEPRIRDAISRLDDAFASDPRLAGWRNCYCRKVIRGGAGPVPDILGEEDFDATLATLYRVVRDLKQRGCQVHLNVSGGRKIMSLCGVTVAQLLFDEADRLWYLRSSADLVTSRELFAADTGQLQMISLPLLRWSPAPPILTDVALADDPVEAIVRLGERLTTIRRRFLTEQLTAAEREVARLLIQTGATDAELAAQLHKSPRTVSHQLATIYDKLRAFLGVRDDIRVDRHTLIAEFAALMSAESEK